MESWVRPGPGCKEHLAHGCYATARSQRDSNPRPRGRWSNTLTTRLSCYLWCDVPASQILQNLHQDERRWTAFTGIKTYLWPYLYQMDSPDLPWHGCYSDGGPAARGGQTVLANDRNGGRLRLIASRHDDDDYNDVRPSVRPSVRPAHLVAARLVTIYVVNLGPIYRASCRR